MKLNILLLVILALSSCASSNVWVQSRTQTGGAIGYQNYNPKDDNNAKINNLIPCPKFVMTWNGWKSRATGAATYYTNDIGISTPIDDGVTRWMEYHYECR